MDKQRKGINCAECRRSKLKCDRKIPCSSCIKRGCANICPDGMQQATKGMKLIITQEENAHLKDRIHELEEALSKLERNTVVSQRREVSSLQDDDDSRGKDEVDPDRTGDEESQNEDPHPLDALGNLTLRDEGSSTFHGTLAHTEYLLKSKPPSGSMPAARGIIASSLPSDVLQLADSFPFGPRTPSDMSMKQKILNYIPGPVMTWHIYELFKAGTSWLYEPVPRREFLDQIYAHVHPTDLGTRDLLSVHPHRLSILFMICAMATLLDTSKDSPIAEAEEWHSLAKASAALQSITDEPTIMGVQAVFLMVVYNYIFDRNGSEKRWFLMGLVSKMMVSIGLHRDSARWKLDFEEVQRRRWVFWDICTYDVWMSFVYGRPPSLSLKHIDCQFPEDAEARLDDQGKPEPTFHTWKSRYTYHVLFGVTEVFGSPKCTYDQVMRMDKAIRKCPVPPDLTIPGLGGKGHSPEWANTLSLALRRYAVLVQRESNLLLIHRAYFSQAMDDEPRHLFSSRYTWSVLAVYRSSCLMIAGLRELLVKHADTVRRIWFHWTGPYTAAVVLSSLIIRVPGCNLAQGALPSLDSVVNLFETYKPMYCPDNALDTLKKLQAKAHQQIDIVKGIPGAQWNEEELEIELPMLDGRTRLISRRRPTQNSSATASPSPQPMQGGEFISVFGDVHPSVLEYFKALDMPSPQNSEDSSSSSGIKSPAQVQLHLSQHQPFADTGAFWTNQWVNNNAAMGFVPGASNGMEPFTMPYNVAPMPTSNGGGQSQSKLSSYASSTSPVQPIDMSSFGTLTAGDQLDWNSLVNQLGVSPSMEQMQTSF